MTEKGAVAIKTEENKKGKVDWIFVLIVALLITYGLVMLYSASSYTAQLSYGSATWYVKKQIQAVVIGAAVMAVCTLLPYRVWRKTSWFLFAASLIFVLLVLSPLGLEAYGAKRWVDLGFISFQPSEALKLCVIIFTAALICKYREKLGDWKVFTGIFCVTLAGAGSVAVITDDLGTAIIIFLCGYLMLFLVSPKIKHLLVALGSIIAAVVALIIAQPYRLTRVKAWLDIEAYADDESYQVVQGLYAIGSGGFFGKGLGKSTQKMGFVPESQNDMIFSIICEELGIVGALVLMLLFALLIWRMWKIFRETDEPFGKLVVAGSIVHIGMQTAVNIGVVTGLIPNTGIPLPFISYGGSSIIMLLAEMGIVLSVARKNECLTLRSKNKKKNSGRKKDLSTQKVLQEKIAENPRRRQLDFESKNKTYVR